MCRARRAAAVVGRSWASWTRKRTPTAADAHNLKIVVKLRAVPASKVPFPVGIAGFPDFSRPVPVYPAFLKYVVPVQLLSGTPSVTANAAPPPSRREAFPRAGNFPSLSRGSLPEGAGTEGD